MNPNDGHDHEERTAALQAAADKRVELKQALSQVEIAAASPSGESHWRDRLVLELEGLEAALDHHVEAVEAEDGLLAELTAAAPRLIKQIDDVRDEHPVLRRQVAEAIAAAKDRSDVGEIRAEVLDALNAIARHRQKGADLVYEGYEVDIGGG